MKNTEDIKNGTLLVADLDARLALWLLVVIESVRACVEVFRWGICL